MILASGEPGAKFKNQSSESLILICEIPLSKIQVRKRIMQIGKFE